MTEEISYPDLLKKDIPPVDYYVDKIIPEESIVIFFGPPDSFKSNSLLWISVKGALGQNVFEFEVKKPFKTLWIDEENRERGMKDKLSKIVKGLKLDDVSALIDNHFLISSGFAIHRPEDIAKLVKLIEQYKPDVVVIDSVAKVFQFDERDETQVKMIYRVLAPLVIKYHITIIMIHHARKKSLDQTSYELEDLSGSREFAAMPDSVVAMCEMNRGEYMLKQVKNRHDKKVYSIEFNVGGTDDAIEVSYSGLVKDRYVAKAVRVVNDIMKLKLESNSKVVIRKELFEKLHEMGYKDNSIEDAINLLKSKDLIKSGVKYGTYEWL